MNIDKCKTCKNFDSFFYSCNLYSKEIYLDEGELNLVPINIKEVKKNECKYENKKV